jgi:hypothetical protein
MGKLRQTLGHVGRNVPHGGRKIKTARDRLWPGASGWLF